MAEEHQPADHGSTREEPPAMPGWVKGLGIALVLLIVAVVLVMLLSGVEHGPGMHG